MTHLEDELRATMQDHRLEHTPPLSVPDRTAGPRRSWTIAASAAVAAALILVLSVVVSSRGGSDSRTAMPPSAVTSSSSPAPGNTQLPPSDITTALTSADHTEQLELLQRLAASVVSYPSAGVFTDSTSTPDGQAWSYNRTRTVPADLSEVFAWYREFYPRATVLAPPENGRAELKLAGIPDPDLAAYSAYSDVQLTVMFEADGEVTAVIARASGTPRLPDDSDRIPAARVVSATLDWFDGNPERAGTRKLSSTDSQAAVRYLNEAPLLVPVTYSGLPNARTYLLTLTTDAGQVFLAQSNTSMPGFGISLTIESVGQVFLDVDPAYSSLIHRLAGA